MKINRFIFIFFIFLSFSCDKISPPFTVDEEELDPYCGNSENTIKKILIEEFTGHRCSACPNAARMVKVKKIFIATISLYWLVTQVVLAYSQTQALNFSYDFRTENATEIAEQFDVNSLPKILLNRIQGEKGSLFLTQEIYQLVVMLIIYYLMKTTTLLHQTLILKLILKKH